VKTQEMEQRNFLNSKSTAPESTSKGRRHRRRKNSTALMDSKTIPGFSNPAVAAALVENENGVDTMYVFGTAWIRAQLSDGSFEWSGPCSQNTDHCSAA